MVYRISKWIGVCTALSVVAGMAVTARAAPTVEPETATAFAATVRPIVSKYCGGCHGGAKPEADLSFDALRDASTLTTQRDAWEAIRENLASHVMPPEGEPEPTAAERQAVVDWLTRAFDRADQQAAKDPGRVTIRRLNRVEYNNTIRDLTGVDFVPAADFPADDVGYGFDNIGDVLSLSPILLEKYLAAAERIAETAIVADIERYQSAIKLEVERMQTASGKQQNYDGLVAFASSGERYAMVEFPREGEYLFRVRGYGDQAGDEPAKCALRIDGQAAKLFEIDAERDKPLHYEAKVKVHSGRRKIAVAFTNDFYDPDNPDRNRRDRNLHVDYIEVRSPDGAPLNPLPEAHRRIVFRAPPAGSPAECAKDIFWRFASRAWRRPATDEEVQRLVKLVEAVMADGEPFERGVQVALTAVLVSPHFVYRVELDDTPSSGPDSEYIGDYRLAARLSYFLWSSLPDEKLFGHAFDGSLRRPDVLRSEVARMLQDPKSQALVDNFGGQWLQYRNLGDAAPNPQLFKQFDEPLRDAMRQETALLFEHVMRENRSLLDLIDADYTFLNERLAKHYGVKNVRGDKFQRVELEDRQRGGVLTQASILTLTSDPTRTSPVKRGKWILENILGTPPPEPPPGVPPLDEGKKAQATGTLRQRFEQHRRDPTCASCHARMDPLGFSLENFDAIGAWRDQDGKFPIDASAVAPDGAKFDGPAGLKQYLTSRPRDFTRCVTEKMLTYALGRGLEYYDRPTVKQIVEQLAKDDFRFTALVNEIVASRPFQMRRGAIEVKE